jgi:hypothetical protein
MVDLCTIINMHCYAFASSSIEREALLLPTALVSLFIDLSLQGGNEEAVKRKSAKDKSTKQHEIDLITAKLALDTKLYEAGLRREQQLGKAKLYSAAKLSKHDAKVAATLTKRRVEQVIVPDSCCFLDSADHVVTEYSDHP